MQIGLNYGYYPLPTKSWLIVRENKAVWLFEGKNIQKSTEGKRHLGAVIGMKENKKNYINGKISTSRNKSTCWQILLPSILKLLTQPMSLVTNIS